MPDPSLRRRRSFVLRLLSEVLFVGRGGWGVGVLARRVTVDALFFLRRRRAGLGPRCRVRVHTSTVQL